MASHTLWGTSMEAPPDDLAKVQECLAELRLRYPAGAMDCLDQVLEAYLTLRRRSSGRSRGSDPWGADALALQAALWAVRRLLLGFFPSSRTKREGDDCSPQAEAAYAAFAQVLGEQARRTSDSTEALLSGLILEWLDMTRAGPGANDRPPVSQVDWDLPHLSRVVDRLERLFRPWLPHLRQQVFRVRGKPVAPATQVTAIRPWPGSGGGSPILPARHA